MTTILVVDDEMPIRRALALNLENRDYEVLLADSGEVALQLMASEKPDLLLLDLGLPGMDGIAVLHALRGWTDVPIIVLTVRDDARSKIAALDAGADDYVTKPFSMGELTARIRAALRRSAPPVDVSTEIVTRSFRLDLDAHRAHRVDVDPHVEVRLTPTEWAIVAFLVRHPGMLVTRRQLVDGVWGPTADPGPTLLRVHMANIRRKLETVPSRPEHFLTDSGVGYRFEPAAEV